MPTTFEFLSSWIAQDRDPTWVIVATEKPSKVIEHLRPLPAGVNHRFGRRDTALMVAALHDRPKTVAALLDHRANVNLQNDDGNTALHTAAFFGRLKIVKMLVAAGADVSICNSEVVTALDIVSRPWTTDIEAKIKNVNDIFALGLRMPQVRQNREVIAQLLAVLKT